MLFQNKLAGCAHYFAQFFNLDGWLQACFLPVKFAACWYHKGRDQHVGWVITCGVESVTYRKNNITFLALTNPIV